jgi:hypothetical protein
MINLNEAEAGRVLAALDVVNMEVGNDEDDDDLIQRIRTAFPVFQEQKDRDDDWDHHWTVEVENDERVSSLRTKFDQYMALWDVASSYPGFDTAAESAQKKANWTGVLMGNMKTVVSRELRPDLYTNLCSVGAICGSHFLRGFFNAGLERVDHEDLDNLCAGTVSHLDHCDKNHLPIISE